MNKTKLLLVLLTILLLTIPFLVYPVDALAHPIDRVDQIKAPHLGLDNPEYFELNAQYWHERRTLFANVIPANALCYGAVNQLEDALNRPRTSIPENLIDYYAVVPAHPCEDYPGNFEVCRQQLKAAKETLSIQSIFLNNCEDLRQYLAKKIKERESALRKKCGSKCKGVK